MNIQKILILSLTTAALAASAFAQAPVHERKHKSYRKDFGTSKVGGYVDVYQGGSREVARQLNCHNGRFVRNASQTYAGIRTGARIFGRNIEAARVEAKCATGDAHTYKVPVVRKFKKWYKKYYWSWKKVGFLKVPVRRYKWRYYWQPRVVGYNTMGYALNKGAFTTELRFGGKTMRRTFFPFGTKVVKKAGPYNVFKKDLKKTFMVGPVPVTCRANAGFTASVQVGAKLNWLKMTTEMGPSANAHGFGWASAGVGGSIGFAKLEAGVKATMKFANTTVGYKVESNLERVFGGFYWKVIPVGFSMHLYAVAKFIRHKVRASLKVFEWNMRGFGGELKLL